MSDMNPIAMTKIAQGSAPQALQGSTSSGVLANFAGSGNFWDMIFGSLMPGEKGNALLGTKLAGTEATANGNANSNANANITNPAQPASGKTELPLAALQVALSNHLIDADGNVIISET